MRWFHVISEPRRDRCAEEIPVAKVIPFLKQSVRDRVREISNFLTNIDGFQYPGTAYCTKGGTEMLVITLSCSAATWE